MRVVTQAEPGFSGKCTCMQYCAVYDTPTQTHITPYYAVLVVVSSQSLVPGPAGWLDGCLAVLPLQRPSLMLGSAALHYGDLARTKVTLGKRMNLGHEIRTCCST